MGVNTTVDSEILTLTATVLSRDGKQIVQGQLILLLARLA